MCKVYLFPAEECGHPIAQELDKCDDARRKRLDECDSENLEREVKWNIPGKCYQCIQKDNDRENQQIKDRVVEESMNDLPFADDELARALEESKKDVPYYDNEEEMKKIMEESRNDMPFPDDDLAQALYLSKQDLPNIAAQEEAMFEQILQKSMAEWDGRGGLAGQGGPSGIYGELPWKQRGASIPSVPIRGYGEVDENIDLDPKGRGKGRRNDSASMRSLPGQPIKAEELSASGAPQPTRTAMNIPNSNRLEDAQHQLGSLTMSSANTQSAESRAMGEVRENQDRAYQASLEADRKKAKKRKEDAAKKAAEEEAKRVAEEAAKNASEAAAEESEEEPETEEFVKAKRAAWLNRLGKPPSE